MKATIKWAALSALVVAVALVGVWAGLSWTNAGAPSVSQPQPPPAPATETAAQPDAGAPTSGAEPQAQAPAPSEDQPAASATEPDGQTEPATPGDGVNVVFGQLSSQINAVEFQLYCVRDIGCVVPQTFLLLGLKPTDIEAQGVVGQRLDYWILNRIPEISVALVEKWFDENRIAVNDRIVGPTHKLASDDLIAMQVTEFSALRVVMRDYLDKPDRVEYDLFEINLTPTTKIKQNGIFDKRYLAVGKLFGQDVRNVDLAVLSDLKDRLKPWEDALYVGSFGPYRVFELN